MKKLFFLLAAIISTVLIGQTADVSKVVKVGQQATIAVTADGTQPFNYQWRKNGSNISGATTNPFILNSITVTNAGAYSVIVSNSAGSTTSNQAIIVVLAPPVFTTQPVNIAVVVGAPISLTAVASGTPAPTYQWYKSGVAISNATGTTYSIPSSALTDAGTYTCIATSTKDGVSTSTTSNASVVTVTVAPPVITGISITIK